MATAEETLEIKGLLSSEEVPFEKLIELRHRVHCSIEKRTELESALSEFGPIAKKLSSENRAEIRRGVGSWVLGRVEEAIPILEPARSSKERAYFLGISYLDVGRNNDALAQLKEAHDADSGDSLIKLAYLEARIKTGNYEDAEKQADQLGKKFEEVAEYHYLRGLLQDVQGYREEAIKEYERALEIEPGHPRALFRLAHTMDLLGDDARAMELYEQLRKLRPVHIHTMINLGTIYEDRGDYERAAECYRGILDYYPNHSRARLYLKDAQASLSMFYDEDAVRREQKIAAVLSQPVAEISFSPRVRNALQKLGITTLGELCEKREEDLMTIPNFGKTSLTEVKDLLASKGLSILVSGDEAAEAGAAETPVGTPGEAPAEVAAKALSEFEWSGRIKKVLEKLGLKTIGDLMGKTEADLLKSKNLGMTSIKEIRKKLGQYGIAMREE